jgi:integrase
MPRRKLTKRSIDSIPSTDKPTGVCYYDTQKGSPTGFGIRVFPSGRKKFFMEYGPETRRRRMTIGAYGDLTLDDAKEKASKIQASIIDGDDPLDGRRAKREMPTFGGWADEYLERVKRRKKRPEEDERYLKVAKKKWGRKPLNSISQRDVETAMEATAEEGKDTTQGPAARSEELKGNTTANRWLASVRACFGAAERAGLLVKNPASAVKLYKEPPPRDRVLTNDEMNAFLGALEKEEDIHTRAAFHLLIETGARRSEVLGAKWDDIDLDDRTWRIPSPKSGNPQIIPLPRTTAAMLKQLPRVGPYLIPGRNPKKPRHDLKGPWNRIKEAAQLGDVTIHDIRRTFGLEVARKQGLHVASRLLRHSDVRITERVYAPLGLEDLKKATDKVSRGRGKVLKFPKTKAK